MGDRTYAAFRLGGHVETIDELDEVVSSIMSESVTDNRTGKVTSSESIVQAMLRRSVEANEPPDFYGCDVNYGTFDDIESVIGNVPGLGAHFTWEAGGDYDAGMKTVMPDGTVFTAGDSNDGATIPLSDLTKARESDEPLAAVDKLIADAKAAEGATLPPFTVSPAVAAYLKIFAAKAA